MNTQQPTTEVRSSGDGVLSIIIAATFALLAVRWTGYAALPYLVIFAPLLSVMAILGLTLVLALTFAVVSAVIRAGGKRS